MPIKTNDPMRPHSAPNDVKQRAASKPKKSCGNN